MVQRHQGCPIATDSIPQYLVTVQISEHGLLRLFPGSFTYVLFGCIFHFEICEPN